MTTNNSSSNASRALDILLLLGDYGEDGAALAEIAKSLNVAKSAAHRTLMALTEQGFAEPAERYGHYRLGSAIFLLAQRQQRLTPQIQKLQPGMTEFTKKTGYTTYIIAQSGFDAVCAEMISRSILPQQQFGIGERMPLGIAAGSVALMATLPEGEREAILQANTERYTQYPAVRHVDVDVVKQQVNETLARGYAVNMGYYLPGVGGLGLPLPKPNPFRVNVAISFNIPLENMKDDVMDNLIEQLKECLNITN